MHFRTQLSKLVEMFFETIEMILDTAPKKIAMDPWKLAKYSQCMEIFVSTTSGTLSNIFIKICHDCKYFAYLMSPLQIVSSYLLSFKDRQNQHGRFWKVFIRSKKTKISVRFHGRKYYANFDGSVANCFELFVFNWKKA